MLSQGVALLRQILIVSSFGFARELDYYSTAYALASVSIFSIAVIIDSVYIGLLSDARAEAGGDAVRQLVRPYMRASIWVSVGVNLLAVLVLPIIVIPFTAGFTAAEKSDLWGLSLYFVPWALLIVPYTAFGACMKSMWHYRQFFIAELMVTLLSTLTIALRHEHVGDIPLAFSIGYGIATVYMGVVLLRDSQIVDGVCFPWRAFGKRLVSHFGSNQVGTLNTLAERFWFSFLPAGGISALGVVQQLTMSLSGLLSFRDAYLVPLADVRGRAQKLTRLLCGLFLIAIATAALVIGMAEPICAALFQYGKVATEDIAQVSRLLSIGMLGLVLSMVATPIWRMLQVGADYRPMAVAHFWASASTMVFGGVLIGWLDLGASGMAMIVVINAAGFCVAALRYARRAGARLEQENQSLLIRALFFFGGAALAANSAAAIAAIPLVRLLAGGATYCTLLLVFAMLHKRCLLSILKGDTQ